MLLTAENYFSPEASMKYFGVSQFKAFEKCEAATMAEIRGEYKPPATTALLVGSYVDAHFEGTLDIFRAKHPEIFKTTGDHGLKAEYKKAEEIIAIAEADPLFMEYMSGEKQIIRTGELFGTEWKIKIDSLLPNRIVDLKVMRSMERVMGRSFVEHWGYDLQMAVYAEIEAHWRAQEARKSNGGMFVYHAPKETFLAVLTKEDPPDKGIIRIPEYRRLECLQYIEKKLPRYVAIKKGEIEAERCGVCPYCRATKTLTDVIDFEDVGFSAAELKAMRGEF